MSILNLIQGSKEWLDYRANGIGGSDAPVIMQAKGAFSTPMKLWEQKTGIAGPTKENVAMSWGKNNEDYARKIMEKKLGIKFKPVVIQHPFIPYMYASLDGLSECGRDVLEVKCPFKSKKDHDLIAGGGIPDKYFPQIQHQVETARHEFPIERAFIGSFFDNETVLSEVEISDSYIQEMLLKEKEFNDCVVNRIPPGKLFDETVRSDDEWMKIAYEVIELKVKEEEIKKALANAKERAIKAANGAKCKGGGIVVYPMEKKGSVEYSKIPELIGVDLDSYRKPSSTYWVVK